MSALTLIHYGSKSFDSNHFHLIKNWRCNKPSGGLWTSPLYSKLGWRDWCDHNEYRICARTNSFLLRLKRGTELLRIVTEEDCNRLPSIPLQYGDFKMINFEELTKKYDGIWLTEEGLKLIDELPFLEPNFYGWDCETVLIFNKECIITI